MSKGSIISSICLALAVISLGSSVGWAHMQEEAASPPAATPAQVIARLQDALLSAMKDGPRVPFAERCEELDPVIATTHDLDFIAQAVMKKYWDQLNDDQKRRFSATFRQLSVATYADKFDLYSGQRFELVEERPLKRGSMLIRTQLIRPDKDPVQLDYVLIQRSGRWLIANVVADGVSDLAVKRAEYESIMEKDGFEVLLAKLQEKVAALPSDAA